MKDQPMITVGIMDGETEVSGRLDGTFHRNGSIPLSGQFSAKAEAGMIVLLDEARREIARAPSIRLTPSSDSISWPDPGHTFTLFHVTIGNRFHWERGEDQTFRGNLVLLHRGDGTVTAINEIPLEDYLTSVISSEMSGASPIEFLKAHAILSRSWLLAALDRKKKGQVNVMPSRGSTQDEVVRWYDREDHDLFDVCSDDHCQRYQGIMKVGSTRAQEAARETLGKVITYRDAICDARYSKACGGVTEEFNTAWEDKRVPFLVSIPDAPVPHPPIGTEEEASAWVLSNPEAYCNTKNPDFLGTILPNVDRKTEAFFRWTVDYSRAELEEILRGKSGVEFGILQQIVPLHRGPSGRISRLRIVGSKRSIVVGKELEIRRWLSWSHLYSSAFVVTFERGRVIVHGAGWGHGVGLCQIGAAVMASRGFSAEEILKHYFRGVEIKKIY
jgi:stage II sporulation protein D